MTPEAHKAIARRFFEEVDAPRFRTYTWRWKIRSPRAPRSRRVGRGRERIEGRTGCCGHRQARHMEPDQHRPYCGRKNCGGLGRGRRGRHLAATGPAGWM